MGYQQMLMLVFSVIIIGVSITIGLDMFTNEMMKFNRKSIISDMNIFAGVANAYYITPVSMAGGNRTWDVDQLGFWFGYNYDADNNSISNNNGVYVFTSSDDVLIIEGIGNEIGNDGIEFVQATLQFTGQNCEIVTTINN